MWLYKMYCEEIKDSISSLLLSWGPKINRMRRSTLSVVPLDEILDEVSQKPARERHVPVSVILDAFENDTQAMAYYYDQTAQTAELGCRPLYFARIYQDRQWPEHLVGEILVSALSLGCEQVPHGAMSRIHQTQVKQALFGGLQRPGSESRGMLEAGPCSTLYQMLREDEQPAWFARLVAEWGVDVFVEFLAARMRTTQYPSLAIHHPQAFRQLVTDNPIVLTAVPDETTDTLEETLVADLVKKLPPAAFWHIDKLVLVALKYVADPLFGPDAAAWEMFLSLLPEWNEDLLTLVEAVAAMSE